MDLVPPQVRAVMARLEEQDARDRDDGTPKQQRLRAVRPEVGDLLLTLLLATGARSVVELGTSGGYSTLWLAVGVSRTGGRVTTFEVDPAKVELATRSFADAGVDGVVELRHEDAGAGLAALELGSADLVFMDSEKEDYERFLALAVTALRPGGLLVADNLTSHEEGLRGFRDAALSHPDLSGLVVPIGRGELVAVRV
jgi:predicted O-methyltransferase YrrM